MWTVKVSWLSDTKQQMNVVWKEDSFWGLRYVLNQVQNWSARQFKDLEETPEGFSLVITKDKE